MSGKIPKTIGVVHLVYLSIIFVGIVVWLIAYIFSDSNYAGSLLSFGATLSSVLLAVIAIIITLIDVAGQRSNILDVKNSVEDLKKVSNDITVIINEFEKRNILREEDILNTITQFNDSIETNSKKFDEITDKIGKISVSGESQDEFEKIKLEINEMKKSLEKPLTDSKYKYSSEVMKFSDLYGDNPYSNKFVFTDTKSFFKNKEVETE